MNLSSSVTCSQAPCGLISRSYNTSLQLFFPHPESITVKNEINKVICSKKTILNNVYNFTLWPIAYIFFFLSFFFLFLLYRLWEVELREDIHPVHNVSVFCIGPTKLRENKLYIAIYVHWSYFFVYYAFPFVALVIFNVAIYKRVSICAIKLVFFFA